MMQSDFGVESLSSSLFQSCPTDYVQVSQEVVGRCLQLQEDQTEVEMEAEAETERKRDWKTKNGNGSESEIEIAADVCVRWGKTLGTMRERWTESADNTCLQLQQQVDPV